MWNLKARDVSEISLFCRAVVRLIKINVDWFNFTWHAKRSRHTPTLTEFISVYRKVANKQVLTSMHKYTDTYTCVVWICACNWCRHVDVYVLWTFSLAFYFDSIFSGCHVTQKQPRRLTHVILIQREHQGKTRAPCSHTFELTSRLYERNV